MLTQISIYTENKKGVLEHITGIFAEKEINIDAMLVNDSAEFGTARFVVDKPDEAVKALTEAGYITKSTRVVGVFLDDNYGELNKLLKRILDANISLDYIYATFERESAAPIVILKSEEESDVIESILLRYGYRLK